MERDLRVSLSAHVADPHCRARSASPPSVAASAEHTFTPAMVSLSAGSLSTSAVREINGVARWALRLGPRPAAHNARWPGTVQVLSSPTKETLKSVSGVGFGPCQNGSAKNSSPSRRASSTE